MSNPGIGSRIPGGHTPKIHIGIVNLLQEKTGNRASAIDAEQPRGTTAESKGSSFIARTAIIFAQVPILPSELEGVLALDPGQQVVDNIRGPPGSVLNIGAGITAEGVEAIAKVNLRRRAVACNTRNLRKVISKRCRNGAVTFIPVEVAAREMVEQGWTEGVVPIQSVHKGVLRGGESLVSQLQGQNSVEIRGSALIIDRNKE